MGKYLDKFRSTLPATQAKQIFEILNGMKDRGSIQTVKEYNALLTELSTQLRSTNPQPTFKMMEAIINRIIRSDRFNVMVDATSRDLQSAFGEAENIATVLDYHKNLYKLTVTKTLAKAVRDLEADIGLYEYFVNDNNGFIKGQANTFADVDGNRAPRLVTEEFGLFYDWRRRVSVDEEEDAQVDPESQRLILGSETSNEIPIADIDIINESGTTISERNVEHPTSSIANMIDRQIFTYWVHPVLASEKIAGRARVKIRLDLGGIRIFNTLLVQTATPFPMILESIQYTHSDGTAYSVPIETVLDGDTSMSLGDITARTITLTIRQDNAEDAFYTYDGVDDLWERVWLDDQDKDDPDTSGIERISNMLVDEIQEEQLLRVLGIGTIDASTVQKAYQYTFGFDNIRLFSNEYQSSSLFVGKKLEADSPGLLAVRASEDNPTIRIGNTSYPRFSFEYLVVKDNFDENSALIDREIVLLPNLNNGKTVTHERLFPIDKTDSTSTNTASLRFTPDISLADPIIHRNLSEDLVINTDYLVKAGDSDWLTTWADVRTYVNGFSLAETPPMDMQIRFNDVSPFAIYTASYQISTRSSDTANDARHRKLSPYLSLQENLIVVCDKRHARDVAKSTMNLVINIRNNYFDRSETGSVLDYKLLVSSYDSTKFVEG